MGAWATSGSQPPDYYGVSFLYMTGRQAPRAGLRSCRTIIRFSFLRFELQGELGTTAVKTAGNNVWGGRSVAIFDLGWLKLKAGAEYDNTTDTNTFTNVDPAKGPVGKVDDGFKQTRKGYGGAANSSTIRTSSLVAALRKVSRPTTTLRLMVRMPRTPSR